MYHGCTNFLEEQATVSITNELLHSKLITSCVNQYVCGLGLETEFLQFRQFGIYSAGVGELSSYKREQKEIS